MDDRDRFYNYLDVVSAGKAVAEALCEGPYYQLYKDHYHTIARAALAAVGEVSSTA